MGLEIKVKMGKLGKSVIVRIPVRMVDGVGDPPIFPALGTSAPFEVAFVGGPCVQDTK